MTRSRPVPGGARRALRLAIVELREAWDETDYQDATDAEWGQLAARVRGIRGDLDALRVARATKGKEE